MNEKERVMKPKSHTLFQMVVILIVLHPLCWQPSPLYAQGYEDAFRPPARILQVAGVKQGMIIGEVGAGSEGFLTFPLAGKVGSSGKIYANDISREYLDQLEQLIKKEAAKNIETVLGRVEDPLFPVNNLDMVIMTDVFHDLEKPFGFVQNVAKYLRQSGLLVIVARDDEKYYEEEWDRFAPHFYTTETILKIFEKTGYMFLRSDSSSLKRDNIYVFQADRAGIDRAWDNYLARFQGAVRKVRENDSFYLNLPRLKLVEWKRIDHDFRADIPHRNEDDILREQVKNEIKKAVSEVTSCEQSEDRITVPVHTSGRETTILRSLYIMTDVQNFGKILKELGFYNAYRKYLGKKFKNLFIPCAKSGESVVFDQATGLMWLQNGSSRFMNFFDALIWVEDLNRNKYGGYCDWRLPTVEEAASLLEKDKSDEGFNIQTVFDKRQSWFWTGDSFDSGHAWFIDLDGGYITQGLMISSCYVRAVRTVSEK